MPGVHQPLEPIAARWAAPAQLFVVCHVMETSRMKDPEYRYLKNADHFLDLLWSVWSRHLKSDDELRQLFEAIETMEEKDLFLRIGAFYRYLVVEGSFSFTKKEWNKGMTYIDDTYKYVAIFSLIEALETPPQYKDFYQWIQSKKDAALPLNKKPMSVIDDMYKEYKKYHGSVQAAVRFFERLDREDQAFIEKKVKINGTNSSVNKLSKLLYDMRSKFAHEARFILGFGSAPSVGTHNGKVLTNKLTMDDLRMLFEHGFLKRFGWKGSTQPCSCSGSQKSRAR